MREYALGGKIGPLQDTMHSSPRGDFILTDPLEVGRGNRRSRRKAGNRRLRVGPRSREASALLSAPQCRQGNDHLQEKKT